MQYYACDFETTSYEGQAYTEVWSAAYVKFGSEQVTIAHSIDEFMFFFIKQRGRQILYFHNLKFDGEFILCWLLRNGFKAAHDGKSWAPEEQLQPAQWTCVISNLGQWYKINLKTKYGMIEFRDSLKLLPFALKDVGKSFKTTHQKLDMEYTGYRYAGCPITPEEEEYIKNDVLVLREALEVMFKEGHQKLTIGSCCLHEYKQIYEKAQYESLFPDLREVQLPCGKTAEEWLRYSYHGGWCYVNPKYQGQVVHDGCTADVNSLYPSMMHSESGNEYPFGLPTYQVGKPDTQRLSNKYWFVHFKTRFYLKPGKLPTVQIKGNYLYRATEWLKTSDVYNYKTKQYVRDYIDADGNKQPAIVELTMTMTDYKLFTEHYYLTDTTYIDYLTFEKTLGIFDLYIDKYRKIKMETTGAQRTIAKLFLNNLYGKMAASDESDYKVPNLKEDGSVGYQAYYAHEKQPGYIAIGSAITSYSRNFTIRSAQANYGNFCYADTDSIHVLGQANRIKGIKIDKNAFCCWKIEQSWHTAKFVRQKTYLEITEDKIDIKCAGMPEPCKAQLRQRYENDVVKIDEFDVGLKVFGKLYPKHIPGGIVLEEGWFEMC